MFERLIRGQIGKQQEKLDRFLSKHKKEHPFPEDVTLVADLDCLSDGVARHKIDVFRPTGVEGALPVVLDIHGGGFLLGSKEVNRLFSADLCKRGFLVLSAEYPLAPDADIFTILRGLCDLLRKVPEVAARFGGDVSRFFLVGDSAGAWLALYLAAMQKSGALAAAAGVDPSDTPRVCALGLQSGMFYTQKLDNIGLFLPSLIYGKGFRRHPFFPYANPEHTEILSHLPPVFLVTGRGDFLRHYSRAYAKALCAFGVPTHFLDLKMPKRLPHAFPAILPELPASKEANDAMADFFKNV